MDISKQTKFAVIKDHSVSKETFELYYDEDTDMLFTYPTPDETLLPKYYESENYISHTDAKRTVFEKIYHLIKGVALQNKLKLINSLSKNKGLLLDIGAGTGDFLSVAKSNGWDSVGIEPNFKAKNNAIQKGIKFCSSTADIESHSVDVITMWHVLEHVPNLDYQISELKRMIKPDGVIVIAVPNYKSFDANHYGAFWAAFDVPRHLWHFSQKSIPILFQKQKMKLIATLPMKFDSFYVSLLSEKYKTGKMNFMTAFCVGLWSNWKAKSNFEYSSLIYILKNQ